MKPIGKFVSLPQYYRHTDADTPAHNIRTRYIYTSFTTLKRNIATFDMPPVCTMSTATKKKHSSTTPWSNQCIRFVEQGNTGTTRNEGYMIKVLEAIPPVADSTNTAIQINNHRGWVTKILRLVQPRWQAPMCKNPGPPSKHHVDIFRPSTLTRWPTPLNNTTYMLSLARSKLLTQHPNEGPYRCTQRYLHKD